MNVSIAEERWKRIGHITMDMFVFCVTKNIFSGYKKNNVYKLKKEGSVGNHQNFSSEPSGGYMLWDLPVCV